MRRRLNEMEIGQQTLARARQEKAQQRQTDAMLPAMEKGTIRYPDWMLVETADEATHKCPECGMVVMPKAVRGGYVKQFCEHEMELGRARSAAFDEERKRQQAQVQTGKILQFQAKSEHAYSWLGAEYTKPGLDKLTFGTYEPYVAYLVKVRAAVQAWSEQAKGVLLMVGPTGVGKTHLACASLNSLRGRGVPGLFCSAPSLWRAIDAKRAQDVDIHPLLVQMARTPLLVLDDIDAVAFTEPRGAFYMDLFDMRTSRATIITTNLSIDGPEGLAASIGPKAASRLNVGLSLLPIKAEDYRKRLKR